MKSSCLTWTSCRSIVYLAPILASLATNPLNAQTEIALSSDRTSRYQIYTQQISPPAAPVQVTTGGGGSQLSSEPDWSPDGSKIAYQFGAPGVRGIHTIDPNGTGDTQITPPGSGSYPCTDDSEPAWSPDGRYIAYICNHSGVYAIWEHDNTLPPNNPNSESLVFGLSTGLLFNPTWSRDGKSLAFVSAIPGNGQPQIQLFTLASKVLTPLTNSAFNDFDPTFSPDGKTIAFSSTRNGARQIFTMSMSCPETQQGCPAPTQLTKDPSDAQHCAWSSDGQWVAFVSNRITTLNPTGKWQIYLLNPSQPEGQHNPAIAVSDGSANDDFPAWPAAAGNGVDLSRYSSDVSDQSWQSMVGSGIHFVIVQAWGGITQSPYAQDQLVGDGTGNTSGAQNNGLLTGAYTLLNYLSYGGSGGDQVNQGITAVGLGMSNLKVMVVDVEPCCVVKTPWIASHKYSKGQEITENQHMQIVITGGKSGTKPPKWNESGGETSGDGQVVWQDFGTPLSQADSLNVICQAVATIQALPNPPKAVIYTSQGFWKSITGNAVSCPAPNQAIILTDLPLWDTETKARFPVDGVQHCGDDFPGLQWQKNDKRPSGWTNRSGNQYDNGPVPKPSKCGGNAIFGITAYDVDLDYFDPSLFQ